MDPRYVQNLRYKLQKRVRRLNSLNSANAFLIGLQQFWRFYDSNPSFLGISNPLLASFFEIDNMVKQIFDQQKGMAGDTEEQAAALGYAVLRRLPQEDQNKIVQIASRYGYAKTVEDSLELIRENFLEPFYEYVDEQLDDQRAVLNLLLRYKHRSEWFNSSSLYTLATQESRKGEIKLALDLYSYLYDQGIDFFIEPSSITGEIDLIGAQHTDDPLVADAKIFDGENRGRSYILKGFNQIYNYTLQYNEPIGYLVVFKITDKNLSFALKTPSEIPLIHHNHKSIFIITIDIHPDPLPISKRGSLRTIEIKEEELITFVEEKRGENLSNSSTASH